MKNVAAWLALTEEERAKALEGQRLRAVARMEALGIRPIHEAGRPYAKAVEAAPSLQRRAVLEVITQRRKRA